MKNTLPDGIPLERYYRILIESDHFKALEQFSDSFLSANKKYLRNYMNKWVKDPLHQWSRQWEYPFVFNRIKKMIHQEPRARILDAGSGITFFPYYVNTQYDAASIYCCDYDETLIGVFEQINNDIGKVVEFSASDLRNLPYGNEWFHMVYCISVLEHTDDYDEIIKEFFRILRPGGNLVVTFDISLDGTRDISVDKGTALLTSLAKRFNKDKDFSLDLHSQVSMPGVFTTLTAKGINANLLPWKYPSFIYRIKSFITTRRFCSWPPPLTVLCLGLTKCST